jgi:hypothetical protein
MGSHPTTHQIAFSGQSGCLNFQEEKNDSSFLWGEDPIGTVARFYYPTAMNKLLIKKIVITIVGTVAIATLSQSAIMLPNNASHSKAALPNHESTTGGAFGKTNSLSVHSHFRLWGTHGPVFPPNLPVQPQDKPNKTPASPH